MARAALIPHVFKQMTPEVFIQDALRAQGFDFYDWTAPQGAAGAARFVTAWNSDPAHVAALARAIASL